MTEYCELDFVCPDHGCEHYKIPVEVRCRTEPLNVTTPIDDRDLDCECGDRLIQHDLLGCESVSPETRRRYKAFAATACLALVGLVGCGGASVARRVNTACGPGAHTVSVESHGTWHTYWVVRCSDGTVRMVGE